jgi:hypothetical protein
MTTETTNIRRMRDAKLLRDALLNVDPGSAREAFLLRLRRSFHQWGSLTCAMREAIATCRVERGGQTRRARNVSQRFQKQQPRVASS